MERIPVMLGDALNYIGGSLEKPGRAVRGLLTGNLREGLAAVPFSDSMGLTDPSQKVTGRNLTDKMGITRTGDKGWGAWALGGAADMGTDPLSYIPMGSVFKGLKMGSAAEHGLTAAPARSMVQGAMSPLPVDTTAMKLGAAVNDASRPRRFSLDPARKDYYAQSRQQRFADRLGFGKPLDAETRSMISPSLSDHVPSFGLKYDNAYGPPPATMRSSPEWINNRTFYHGSGMPGITGDMIDPMKTAPDNLYGRGMYTTADQKIGREYTDKGLADAGSRLSRGLTQSPFFESSLERASNGDFDDFLKTHGELLGLDANQVSTLRPTMKRNFMRRFSEEHLNPITDSILGDNYENSPRRLAVKAAADLYAPHIPRPRASLYAAQSDFGKILDVERRMPAKEYSSLFDSLTPTFGLNHYGAPPDMAKYLPTGEPQIPNSLIKATATWGNENTGDAVKAIRSHGYDALTHTGGMSMGGGIPHQVVIGLDPNDVLGLGRKTPYKRWEQVNGSRKPSASVLDGSNNGASSALHSGTGSQPGGAGLSTSIRHLPSDSKATRIGEAQPLFKDNDVGNQHVNAMTKQLLDNLPGLNVAEPHAAVMRSDVRNMIQRLGDTIYDKMEHGGTHHNASLTYEKVPWDKVNQRGDYRYPSDALSEVVKGGGHLPPVQVSRDAAGQLHLLDGHHRGRAYAMAGQKVPAWVGQLHDATPNSNSLIEFLKDESGKLTLGSGQQSGAGLDTSLRSLREDIPVFKPGGRVVGRGGWEGDLSKAGQLHQELEDSGELLGANVPPWFKGNDLIGDAAGTAGIYGRNPSTAREELMHAMTSKAAQEGNVGSLPMLARPAAHMYRAANATGSPTLRGLGSIADELSAKTMAQKTTRGKLGAAMDFLLSPEAHLLYDQQFASHGIIPRAAYHSIPLASPAGSLGAAGYSLANGE